MLATVALEELKGVRSCRRKAPDERRRTLLRVQQLSVIDTTFLASETPRTPNHLCMTNVYDPSTAPHGRPSFEQILAKLRSCLPGTTSLRRKLVRVPLGVDRPYWVEDPDFDVEFHVRHLALPKPATGRNSPRRSRASMRGRSISRDRRGR